MKKNRGWGTGCSVSFPWSVHRLYLQVRPTRKQLIQELLQSIKSPNQPPIPVGRQPKRLTQQLRHRLQ